MSRMDNLLNQSLVKNKEVGQPFSSTAHFMLGWFGGGIAAALFCCLSIKKMGLIKTKRFELALLLLISFVGTAYFIAIYKGLMVPPFGIESDLVIKNIRIINQLFGVTVYGVFFLFFKKYLSSARFNDAPVPSPWRPALACIGIGLATIFGLAFAFSFIKIA